MTAGDRQSTSARGPATETSKARALITSVVGDLQVSNMQESKVLTHEEWLRRLDSDDDEALGLADGSKTETPPSEESLNELREMALGIAPTNTIEAMLALQITQLHRLAIAQAFTLTLNQTVESAAQCAKILDTSSALSPATPRRSASCGTSPGGGSSPSVLRRSVEPTAISGNASALRQRNRRQGTFRQSAPSK